MAMYMQRTTSGAAGNGLYTTTKYMCGASGIGMGTTVKHLRRTTSGAAGNGLGTTMKYLRRTTSAAANKGLSTTIIPPCSAASFEVNSEPHTGARPSVRLCVGPELARYVHIPRLWPLDGIRLGFAPCLIKHPKSSQVSTHSKEKSQAKDKRAKDRQKYAALRCKN
jgi:hypothetical protein